MTSGEVQVLVQEFRFAIVDGLREAYNIHLDREAQRTRLDIAGQILAGFLANNNRVCARQTWTECAQEALKAADALIVAAGEGE